MSTERPLSPVSEVTEVESRYADFAPPLGMVLLDAPTLDLPVESTEQVTWRRHAVAAQREAAVQRVAWRAGLGSPLAPPSPAAVRTLPAAEAPTISRPPKRQSAATPAPPPAPLVLPAVPVRKPSTQRRGERADAPPAGLWLGVFALGLFGTLSAFLAAIILAPSLGVVPPLVAAFVGLGAMFFGFGTVCVGAVVGEARGRGGA